MLLAKNYVTNQTSIGEKKMKCCNENLIKEAAYYIWEKAGKPCGQDACHWAQAEKEVSKLLGSCSSKKSSSKKSTAKKSTAKSATKKTTAKAATKKTTTKKASAKKSK